MEGKRKNLRNRIIYNAFLWSASSTTICVVCWQIRQKLTRGLSFWSRSSSAVAMSISAGLVLLLNSCKVLATFKGPLVIHHTMALRVRIQEVSPRSPTRAAGLQVCTCWHSDFMLAMAISESILAPISRDNRLATRLVAVPHHLRLGVEELVLVTCGHLQSP